MSGDRGFGVVAAAALAVTRRHPGVRLILVGDEAALREAVGGEASGIGFHHADEVVTMEDSPVDALRRKKASSMRRAIDLVKSGDAAACVSAGNTGALMATAKFVLKTIDGIDRPAIMAELPGRTGRVFMLDVGANAMSDAEQLFQFAVMGAVVTRQLTGVPEPRVALLNIGEEDIKGNDTVRQAAALLEASDLNYSGFVEGNAIFDGDVDVIVTDGFTGNVALKTMEGTASLVADFLRQTFTNSLLSRLQGLVAMPALARLRARMDPRAYNGASFVGLNGIVIKSHGSADTVAFEHAIETALLVVQDNIPAEINRRLNLRAE